MNSKITLITQGNRTVLQYNGAYISIAEAVNLFNSKIEVMNTLEQEANELKQKNYNLARANTYLKGLNPKFKIDKAKIRSLKAQGIKMEDIAKQFGVSRRTIQRYLKE